MEIRQAEFVSSETDVKRCPPAEKPEFAFIGRSNVGKSSLLNALTARKNLAKTSNKPGKTQTINHFIINDNWYLVDLPGYGYAKVSKEKRAGFGKIIENGDLMVCVERFLDKNGADVTRAPGDK